MPAVEFYELSGPGSTTLSRDLVQLDEVGEGQIQRLRNLQEIQVRRIAPARFETADIRAIEVTFRRQLLLGPILPGSKTAHALTQTSEGGMRRGARRHPAMVTMGNRKVYRPGSTRPDLDRRVTPEAER